MELYVLRNELPYQFALLRDKKYAKQMISLFTFLALSFILCTVFLHSSTISHKNFSNDIKKCV